MFSRSNHHDQKVPNHGLALPTILTPQPPTGDSPVHSDTLSVHYLRLESSLDSALATLTIICDYVHTSTSPALASHTIEVLQALCRHASALITHHTPDATPTEPSSLPPTTSPATYAEAATCTADDPIVKPEEDRSLTPADAKPTAAVTAPRTSTAPAPTKAQTRPDLIFRLDQLPPAVSAAATRPSPARLFIDIKAKSKSILADLHLASIRWTAKGNLTFAFLRDENFSTEKAVKQAPILWNFIRSFLKLSKQHMPRVDRGDSWHNIVVHGVPISNTAKRRSSGFTVQQLALEGVDSWLRESGVVGNINAMSFMCKDADLIARDTAPLRISLGSQTDADLLVQNGALILGSQCRVSRYAAKPQA